MTDHPESLDANPDALTGAVGIKSVLGNMLVIEKEGGSLDWVHRTPKNQLLYDHERYGVNVLLVSDDPSQPPQCVRDTPENREQFAHYDYRPERRSLYEFLHGAPRNDLLVLNDGEPTVAIAPTNESNVYKLRLGGREEHAVYTPANRSNNVLEGIISLFDSGSIEELAEVYEYVLKNQVRRSMVEKFIEWGVFPSECIEVTGDGWVLTPLDEYGEPDTVRFIVTYEAENFLYTHNWDAASYTPRARENDSAGQFRSLDFTGVETITETVYETTERAGRIEMEERVYNFGELETTFLHTVSYLLNWVENFGDTASVTVIRRTYQNHGGTLR
jgi:hypothetical protein